MAIQINASARLHAAKADKEQARRYLQSLGVAVGNFEGSGDNLISFEVPYKSFDAAVNALTKKLGRPQSLLPDGDRDTHLRWQIKGLGFVTLFRDSTHREADISIRNAPGRA